MEGLKGWLRMMCQLIGSIQNEVPEVLILNLTLHLRDEDTICLTFSESEVQGMAAKITGKSDRRTPKAGVGHARIL